MVSVNSISSSSKAQTETLDSMDATLPGLNNSLQPQPAEEDGSKKVRKPYVISKSRESWTDMEHDKFLEALHLFDRDWKKIEAFVGSKNVIQIRSHAQKYFLKVQKNGMSEHVPPPRPKRKAAHPYPQKAFKIAHVDSQVLEPVQPIVPVVQPVYALPSSSAMPSSNAAYSTWTNGSAPQVGISHISNDRSGVLGATTASNFGCSSSTESNSRSWCANLSNEQGNLDVPIRAIPDFAQVYNFIGSMFDPNTSGHLQKLKNMDPINVETTLLLMRNLASNLTSPEFEGHRQLLASYNVLPGKGNTFDNMQSRVHQSAISTS